MTHGWGHIGVWGRARLARLLGLAVLLLIAAAPSETARGGDAPSAATGAHAAVAPPVPAFRQANNLAVITIEGEINGTTALSVKRRIKEAVDGGADGIVIELNTPGGEVFSVIEICKAVKASGKHTIAWVHPDAYSGGAFIALACNEIVVSPGATMGDAAPVVPDLLKYFQTLARPERAKAISPLLVELVDNARANDYDENLVVSLVTLGVELWMVENTLTGKRYFLTEQEYRDLFNRDPARTHPIVASAGDATHDSPKGTAKEEVELNQPLDGPADSRTAFRSPSKDIPNKVINELNNEVTGLSEVSKRPNFKRQDASQYRDLGRATDGKTLLTMKETTIKEFGLAAKTIADDEALRQFTGSQNLRRLDMSWGESLAWHVDSSSMVGLAYRGLLIIVFLICLFLELTMPGATVPGIVAVAALAGLILPSLLVGSAAWWALAAIGGGVILLLLEIFVLPGFGVAGIAGLLLLLGGLVGTFAQAGELFPGSGGRGGDLSWAVSIVLLALFAAGVGMFLFSKYTRSFPIAGRLVLAGARPNDDGEGMLAAMDPLPPAPLGVRVGDVGKTTTPLRPAGTAEFDGKLIDVVAEFGFIDSGTPVRVVSSSFRVGVEAIKDPSGGAHAAEGAA